MTLLKASGLLTVAVVLIGSDASKAKEKSNPFVWQGTHWCGIGERDTQVRSVNNATNADKCCKEHDECPHYISRWSTKYNLFNWRLYTISSCLCDKKFRKCLEQDDSLISRDIRRIYFDMLQVPCFDIKMKATKSCVAWYWYLKCKEYKEWIEPYAVIRD